MPGEEWGWANGAWGLGPESTFSTSRTAFAGLVVVGGFWEGILPGFPSPHLRHFPERIYAVRVVVLEASEISPLISNKKGNDLYVRVVVYLLSHLTVL